MIKKTGFTVFILFSLLGCLFSSNGNRNIRFRQISLEEGLSQSVIKCIVQDSKGFMWFGAQDGLNKYDGCGVEIYRPVPGDPDSLAVNGIAKIHEDRRGVLWIGTDGGGLHKFNRETNTFSRYQNRPGDPSSLSSDLVTDIFEDRSGVLWVGTTDGLNKFHPETGTFTRYRDIDDDPAGLSSSNITVIYQDRSGVLWIGTQSGLNRFNPAAGRCVRYRAHLGNPVSLSSDNITAVYEDHSGEFWIGTVKGLNRMERKTGEFVDYRFNSSIPNSLSNNYVTSICEDHVGVLWIGTNYGGLNIFDRRSNGFFHYKYSPYDSVSLGSNRVTSIYEDRFGVVWIGTYGAGVNRFDRQAEKFRHYCLDPNNPTNTLSNNLVLSLIEDRSGMIWIGSEGGLDKYDRKNRRYTHYPVEPGKSDDVIFSIHKTAAGELWLGSRQNGLIKFDPETGTSVIYRNRPDDSSSLSSNYVWVVFEDSDGVFWLGTMYGGLNKFDRKTERFTAFRHDPEVPHSLGGESVMALFEDRSGILWIGTRYGGLNSMDRHTGRLTRYRHIPSEPGSLSSNNIRSFYQDPSDPTGILWIGTFGGGLNKFDPRTGTSTHYREKDGLPNDVVYGILPDETGCLWLSTNIGLSKFDPRTGTFKNYTSRDGLQSNEFNAGAYYKSKSGEMFFGGVKGFNTFFPGDIKSNTNIPPIVITGFLLFNRSVGIGSDSPLKKHISECSEIILSYRQNAFSFNFVALDYTIPGKNKYKYILEGFDKEWVFTGADKRHAAYTNLDPGEYIFRVTGSNNDGVWNEQGTSIKVLITPPYWQTWWFRLFSVLSALVMVVVFYKKRMKIVSRRMRLEAELQSARTAQMSIMPQSDPQVEGFLVSGICVPTHEVGGDFFDYTWLDSEKTKFGIAVGDVSGKGMKAAMTAVMSSGMLYSKIDRTSSVKDIMTEVNRPLFNKTDKRMFTALCLASLDLRTKEFIFTNAGLNEPLLKSRDTASYIESHGSRLPLGSFKGNVYRHTTLRLKPSDVVVLFTDGIPDSRNPDGEFYGYDTLKDLVEKMDTARLSPADIKDRIISDVKRFSGDHPQQDDITVVVVKYQGISRK